jgi:hypothetical protein
MPRVFDKKTLKLKQGDICARLRGKLTAMVWKHKQNMLIFTDMHKPLKEGNFCDKQG